MSLAEQPRTEPGAAASREALLSLVEARVPPERAAAVGAFARAYLRRLSPETFEALGPDDLYAEVLGLFELASGRGARPAAVRAFNPTRERDGYEPAGSVLETNTADLPFLVDSVLAQLARRGLGIRRVLHPIVGVQRDEDGRIVRVAHPREGLPLESAMHFDLDRRLSEPELADLERAVREVLETVRRVVLAFPAIRQKLGRMVAIARAGVARYPAEEVEEVVRFLEWLQEGSFVFLGYREYAFDDAIRVVPGSGLGLLEDESRSRYATPVPLEELPPAIRERALTGELLIVSKTNRVSPVHRNARMDYVGIRIIAPDGRVAGEARLLGLFTTKAYAEPASRTPLLHAKLQRILAAEDLVPGSHDYKAAVSLFESFPKDELFAAPTEDLRRAVVALLGLQADEVRLLGRLALDRRSASLIAALPRARYDGTLVERLRALLRRRFGTEDVASELVLGGDDGHVRVHFTVHDARGLPEVDLRELERELVALTRTWDDRLRARLVERLGRVRGRELAERWAPRFPEYYKAATDPGLAVQDIAGFERIVDGPAEFAVGLQNESTAGVALTRVALYKRGGKVELSQAMPLLEHLGLRVIEEVPTRLLGGDGETWVQDFGVLGPGDMALDLEACGSRVAECVEAVWRGEAESDSLNRLVVTGGLDWRQVALLRAYRKYRQRIGSRYTEGFQHDALAAHPAVTAKLVRLFELRFDPAHPRDGAAEAALREEILADLDAVESLDHDRVLRNQLGLIDATKRTNAYRPGRGALAFKLRSPEVPAIPRPAPEWEIYVYSPEMEGVHLRGGKIARGGIRWSDRQDYRTEVYGLMRAQLVKNAVIVPEGAKGGFLLRRAPAGRGELLAEVERRYIAYISALLDVTDNLVDGAVVHPEGVRVLDEDDTYLVVAADKGTATLSDTANGVARRYGFWLDDAFASGGSTGYDHKSLGITARGAWESVKRHFRELGVDPERDVIRVVGIGDMSGDVFGNGMLLSRTLKLVGAYDHRHVFLDPDPDPEASFAERRRLFELPASSWDAYDRSLISEGGGVWPRSAKRIPLSPQVRAALRVDAEELPPTEVIRAILRAPVDLLWNGGIGTVVKATEESDADAQDRSSDAIRVNGAELRCRVVAEGGNLGLTRRARVEYARAGGRVNADFIDNSAGVDCSDHEVNLKILLSLAVRRGELSEDERVALLREVTDDVVAHVLYDSFEQAQIIAQEVEGSAGRVDAYEDLMARLEEAGLLDRAAEGLPSTEEMAERRRSGEGLERPEVAILVAYAKRRIAAALLATDLPDDPWLARDLRRYFPDPVVARFGHLLGEHPLRRELIATLSANQVVNSLGPTFVSYLAAERGAEPAEIVRAYRIAREVTGARERWAAIERLDQLDHELQGALMRSADRLVESLARWYLSWAPGAELEPAIAAGRAGFAALVEALPGLGAEEFRAERAAAVARLVDQGVPERLALEHVGLSELEQTGEVTDLAQSCRRSVAEVAATFHLLAERLRLHWLGRQLDGLPAETRTQRWAVQALREDTLRALRELAEGALLARPGASVEEAVDAYLADREAQQRRFGTFIRSLGVEAAGELPALTLAVRHLRALVG
jgi:glutamate dehydrogenase